MASATLTDKPPITRPLSPVAGVLSYLVPGLGQIVQGRVGKGLLFLVCVYALFFRGLWLGTSTVTLEGVSYHVSGNVYLPDAADEENRDRQLPPLIQNLYTRPQFAGQFWVGVAVWPAIVQYLHHDRKVVREIDNRLYELRRKLSQAGAEDDPEKIRAEIAHLESHPKYRHPILGDFMREPSAEATNVINNANDKRLELAWVFTVIAGVLNIMVIYDAVAGAAYATAGGHEEKKD